jgi:methionine biosynthesis protein MetW
VDASKKDYPVHSDPQSTLLENETAIGKIVKLIAPGSTVLDVGCATGYLAELLRPKNCVVTGIDNNAEAAKTARKHCAEVIVADLETQSLPALFKRKKFDVVVFADVLEHLKAPGDVLQAAHRIVKPGGHVVASIPNIAHGAIRLALLAGNFDYTELGILDDTHLRFFTAKTLEEMFLATGYHIEQVDRTTVPLFGTSDLVPQLSEADFSAAVVDEVRRDPEHETLQFIVRAAPLAPAARNRQLAKRFLQANTELARVNAALRSRESNLAQIEVQRAELAAAADAAHREMLKAQTEFQNRDAELERAHARITELEGQDGVLTEGGHEAQRELLELRAALLKAQTEFQDRDAELERAHGHITELERQLGEVPFARRAGDAAGVEEIERQCRVLTEAGREAQRELLELRAALQHRDAEAENANAHSAQLQGQLAESEAALQARAGAVRDAQTEVEKAHAAVRSRDAEVERATAYIRHVETQRDEATRAMQNAQFEVLKSQAALQSREAEIERAKAGFLQLERQQAELVASTDTAHREMVRVQHELKNRELDVQRAAAHIGEIESEIVAVRAALQRRDEDIERAVAHIGELESEMVAVRAALQNRDAEVEGAVAHIGNLETALQNRDAALAQLNEELLSAKQTMDEVNSRFDETRRQLFEQTNSFLAVTQAERERLALLIDTVQSSRFWQLKRVLGRVRRAFTA